MEKKCSKKWGVASCVRSKAINQSFFERNLKNCAARRNYTFFKSSILLCIHRFSDSTFNTCASSKSKAPHIYYYIYFIA